MLETLRCGLAAVPFAAVLPGYILGGPGSQAIQSAIDLQLVPTAIIGLSSAAAFALANSAEALRERRPHRGGIDRSSGADAVRPRGDRRRPFDPPVPFSPGRPAASRERPPSKGAGAS